MKTHQIGRHTLTYGDDGISVMVYRGHVSAEEMRDILDTEDLSNVPEVILLLCDMREFGGMHGEARRLGATGPKLAKKYFTAYIGFGFALQVFVTMWSKATNILQGDKFVTQCFDDPDAARAWLLEQKELFQRQNAR